MVLQSYWIRYRGESFLGSSHAPTHSALHMRCRRIITRVVVAIVSRMASCLGWQVCGLIWGAQLWRRVMFAATRTTGCLMCSGPTQRPAQARLPSRSSCTLASRRSNSSTSTSCLTCAWRSLISVDGPLDLHEPTTRFVRPRCDLVGRPPHLATVRSAMCKAPHAGSQP